MMYKTFSIIIQILLSLALFSGCASYEKFRLMTEELEIPSKVFRSEFSQTWQSVSQVLKRYDVAVHDRVAGVIKTRWIDNTVELNFSDSFGKNDSVKAAKYRIMLNVVKGYRLGREVTKVTIYKRQLIEQDFLQGWKEIPSDTIHEKTLLYRIERLIRIDNKLKAIDKAREKEQINEF